MLRQIWRYFTAWLQGDDAELNIDKTWFITWWDMGFILVIVGILIYWIWS